MIVDDHSIVREGLKRVLSAKTDIEVVAEAASGQEAMDLAASKDLDIVILDIGMSGRGGLEVLVSLKDLKPSLAVIIFSMYSEGQYGIRCFKNGASAYISKKSPPEELFKAIAAISAGRTYITPAIGEKMASLLKGGDTGALHESLSDRELQILVGIGSGKSIAKIGEELCLSPKTVSTYKTRILEKMRMDNTSQLIKYVLEEDLQ
jgi:DNA-binding NarL/FixJ family response regulator